MFNRKTHTPPVKSCPIVMKAPEKTRENSLRQQGYKKALRVRERFFMFEKNTCCKIRSS
jgi:hypothetical protein